MPLASGKPYRSADARRLAKEHSIAGSRQLDSAIAQSRLSPLGVFRVAAFEFGHRNDAKVKQCRCPLLCPDAFSPFMVSN